MVHVLWLGIFIHGSNDFISFILVAASGGGPVSFSPFKTLKKIPSLPEIGYVFIQITFPFCTPSSIYLFSGVPSSLRETIHLTTSFSPPTLVWTLSKDSLSII